MKFEELIKSNQWLSVEHTFLQLYPSIENMIDEYRDLFDSLKYMEAEDCEMKIMLIERKDEINEEDSFIEVCGQAFSTDTNENINYAIEYERWSKWLGMEIAAETLQGYTEYEIIAHCLYEMTFVGFDEEEIQSQYDLLKKTIEEFENMSEEERNKNTYTLDEFMKLLEDENNFDNT